jgi:L,D-transpeptidase YcbB
MKHLKIRVRLYRQIYFYLLIPLLVLNSNCRNDPGKHAEINSLPEECYPDSLQIKYYLLNRAADDQLNKTLLSFYQHRKFMPAWINNNGVNEFSGNFINLLNNEDNAPKNENGSYLPELEELYKSVITNVDTLCYQDSLALKLEVALTASFFEYARRNWGGVEDSVLKKVNWFMDRKKINYAQLLNSYLSGSRPVSINEPVYGQYALLKQYLKHYYELEMLGGWQIPEISKNVKLKKGDSSSVIVKIKQQLHMLEDLNSGDNGPVFNQQLENAVKKFQERHGLIVDGIISGQTLKAMQVPVSDRIQQILINMERCRWVPLAIRNDYIIVNIPEFKMHVYKKNKHEWSCNVIVGKSNAVNNTVVFNDSIEFVVFSPYWNITETIFTKEMLPEILKDRRYLVKNNLEVIDRSGRIIPESELDWNRYTDHFPYILRERPGKNNSLGQVKFLFPNSYEIYMHDTPAKALFTQTSRAFSHGCIRLQEPAKLAEFLLQEDPKWTAEKISEAMSGGKEIFVKLKKKVPVFIAYFTAWVDDEGRLNFRDDVYGHDERMREILSVNY